MSHYVMGIAIPKDGSFGLEEIMRPYSENLEVEEYDKVCYCVGSKARDESFKQAYQQMGIVIYGKDFENFGEYRDYFNNEFKDHDSEVRSELWEKNRKLANEFEKEFQENHPLKDKPNSDCEDCNGTGLYKSTYNPNSKWDWYSIGGRWDLNECLEDYQLKAETPELQNDIDTLLYKRTYLDANLLTYSEALDLIKVCRSVYNYGFFFGFVFPNAEKEYTWFEKGEMGWFGVVSNEDDEYDSLKLLEEHKDILQDYDIVIVDCHI